MWIRNTQKESHLGSEYSIEQWVLSRVDSSAFTMTVLTCKVFWHFVKRGKVSNDDTDTPYLGWYGFMVNFIKTTWIEVELPVENVQKLHIFSTRFTPVFGLCQFLNIFWLIPRYIDILHIFLKISFLSLCIIISICVISINRYALISWVLFLNIPLRHLSDALKY